MERGATTGDGKLDALVEEFVERLRAGQHPSLSDYVRRYPQYAEQIGELFPAFIALEDIAQSKAGSQPAGAHGRHPSSATPLPDRLGDYRIVGEIGRGGMGVVYEAVQLSLGRSVALKVLKSATLSNSSQRIRFEREARTAARLHHTNVVPVFGVGECDGEHYYVMQLIRGPSLDLVLAELKSLDAATNSAVSCSGPASVPGSGPTTGPSCPAARAASSLRGGPLSLESSSQSHYWKAVARIGMQVADALDYASAQGILHRDIKPSNLLLDDHGTVWITDFGLAKSACDGALTETGDILGTLRYMAPEVLKGEYDHRSDLYSLGLTLYELLTLEPAFGETARRQLLLEVAESRVVPLHRKVRGIPADLETIVMKAAARDPAARYQKAGAMADDLRSFLAGQPIRARSLGPFQRFRMWARRNPAVASLSALLFVALAGVAIASSLAYFREVSHSRSIEDKNVEISRGLYRSLVDQARANRLSRRVGQRFKSLEVIADASRMARELSLPEEDFLELRNEAIACLTLPDVKIEPQGNIWPADSFAVDFESTLERYARVDREGNISVRRVSDDAEVWKLIGMGPGEAWPELSADGQFLAVWNSNGLKVWKLTGQEPTVVLERSDKTFAFSSDGGQITTRHGNGTLTVFELPAVRQIEQIRIGNGIGHLAYHPRDRQLAIGWHAQELVRHTTSAGIPFWLPNTSNSLSDIQIRDLETGSVLKELPDSRGAMSLAWHPDGKSLAGLGADRVIQFWDVDSGKPTIQLKGHTNGGIRFALDHAGNLVASTSWDGTLRLWDSRTGAQLFQTPAAIQCLHFSPDDKRLAAAMLEDRRLCTLEIAPFRSFYRTLVRDAVLGRGIYYEPAVSPDGRLLAVGMWDGVGIWDLTRGSPLTFLPLGLNFAVRFEPSGAVLTSGPTGVVRRQVEVDIPGPGMVRIGPPQPLPLPGLSANISLSADGRVVAKAMGAGGLVWHQDLPGLPIALAPHDDVRCICVSFDGRRVVTGSHWGTKVRIWDAQTGQLDRELPVEGGSNVIFSPDGRWLVTTFEGNRLWATDSWQEARFIGGSGAVAFSPDGRILAVEHGNGVIRLLDPETGHEYARLEDPHQDRAHRLVFVPDGAQLVATNDDSASIHVWDLRAIRAQLHEMGLDWELPAYSSLPAGADRPGLQLEVDRALPDVPNER